MSQQRTSEVELEYPIQINGQDVIVKRYSNPEMESHLGDRRRLDFHRQPSRIYHRGPQLKRAKF